MIKSTTEIRVRYSETDKMGFVYHGNYPAYYEIGRTELMREFNLLYKDLENQGILMPVKDLGITFTKPAFYDEILTIETSIEKMPAATIRFDYKIFNESNSLINEGYTILAFIKSGNYRPTRPPSDFLKQLRGYFP